MTGKSKDKAVVNGQPNRHARPATFKIVVLGKGAVGKSAITLQFTQSIFSDQYGPTIEDSFHKQCIIETVPAHLDILDTSGQDEYAALREDHMRRGEGFLIVFSLTDKQSFDEVDIIRNALIRVKDRYDFPMVIAGNKCDLLHERQVSPEAAKRLVESYGSKFCEYVETSAKTKENIDLAFENLVKLMRKHRECNQTPAAGKSKSPRRKRCVLL